MSVAHQQAFDPLVEFDGLWTLALAHRYLPVDGMPPTRFEAIDGRLVMSPREGSANSFAAMRLGWLLDEPARRAGHAVYGALNVSLGQQSWIEPDLVVLRKPVREQVWVDASNVLITVEIVSPSSRNRDRIDKPKICSDAGIPFYMRVEIARGEAFVELSRTGGETYRPIAKAFSGQRLTATEPFALDFDPADLLEP